MDRSRGRWLAAWFALAGLASPAAAAPVDVVPGTPEVACPDQVAVQEALFAQVGNSAPAGGWRLSYRSTGDTADAARGRRGALRLDLTDDRGQSRLQRQLRVEGGDCRARAEAIALIVYRFFAQLGGAGSESLPPSPPLAPVLPSSPPPLPHASPPRRTTALARESPPSRSPPPPSPPPAALVAAAPARPPGRLRLSLEAGAGLWTRRPGAGTTVLGLRVASANLEAAFNLLGPRAAAEERSAEGGEAQVSALGTAISLGPVREKGRLRLVGGPMLIVCREWARSRKIAISADNTGTTAALGVAAGASWRLWGGLRLGMDAGLGHAVLGDRFVVGGWGPVLAPPPWQGMVLARLGYTVSP